MSLFEQPKKIWYRDKKGKLHWRFAITAEDIERQHEWEQRILTERLKRRAAEYE